MRIIHLCNYFQPLLGYQEYFLAREHALMGHEVYVVTGERYFPFPDYDNTVKNILGSRFVKSGITKLEGFEIIRLKVVFEKNSRVWLSGLEKEIKKIGPDLIICHGITSFNASRIIGLKKKLGFKLVYDDHMVFAVENKSCSAKLFYFLFDFKKILKNADKIIGVSSDTVDFMTSKYRLPKECIELVSLGADTELFKFNADSRNSFRKNNKIGKDAVAIVYTGKITEIKAPHNILIALEKIKNKIKNEVVVIFAGGIEKGYKNKFNDYKIKVINDFRIIELPMILNKDLPALYSAADIAVWPVEPTASMIEAASCSLPIIGCKSMNERYNNNNGIGIRPGDINELTDALLKLINDKELRKQMGVNGRKLIEKELSWKIIAERFLKIKKRILFVAPQSLPVTGQSSISNVLLISLKNRFFVSEINYGRNNALQKSNLSLSYIFRIFRLGKMIKENRNKTNITYLTISQSFFGNLKDLYFLYKMGKAMRMNTIVHLHGGFFHEFLKNAPFIIKMLNKKFFKEIKTGIVLSESLRECLTPVMDQSKIKIINNFAEDEFRINPKELENKWKSSKKINILFLSNLMEEKGYNELLEGLLMLPENFKDKFVLNFAGEFESAHQKKIFLGKIKNIHSVNYLGFIDGAEKIKILKESHCFFLPTYVSFGEGQPVSILESYAAGLVVFTTDHGGIKDIFKDKINGRFLKKRSSESIKNILTDFEKDFAEYKKMAFNNLEYSKVFSKEKFLKKMNEVFGEIGKTQ